MIDVFRLGPDHLRTPNDRVIFVNSSETNWYLVLVAKTDTEETEVIFLNPTKIRVLQTSILIHISQTYLIHLIANLNFYLHCITAYQYSAYIIGQTHNQGEFST